MRKTIILLTALLWTLAGASVASAQNQTYGSSMDTFQNALEYNPTNQASSWVNPDTGGTATVTPVRTFAGGQGEPCREFQQTIVIGGSEQQGYGTACRQPDGSWQIVSGQPAAAATTVAQQSTVYVREVPTRYYTPYATPYYPYGYYDPWGYAYPYWYPFNFSLSLGYFYSDGKYYRGHSHGGHYYKGYKGYKGGHYYKGGHSYKGYKGGHSYKGGHGGGGSYKGGYKGGGGGHRR